MGYSLKNCIREDKINTNGDCPIVIRITINRQSYRHPIGENINPKDWNKQEEIPRKSSAKRDIITTKIETEKNKIRDILNQFYYNNNKEYPSINQLKEIIKSQKGDKNDSKSIYQYYTDFVDDYVKKRTWKMAQRESISILGID